MARTISGTDQLILGTMYFGTRTDEATSFALMDRFVEAGGRMLDTANCYAFWTNDSGESGQSEAVIGRWLAANPGVDVQIASKVGVTPVDGHLEGLSGRVIIREAYRSLERLGVDALDVYFAHGEDRSVDLAETVAALGVLVKRGEVRRLGVSNHPTWRVERARQIAVDAGLEPYTVLQLTTSYVDPRPGAAVDGKDHRFGFATDETFDYLAEHPEMELWAYSPLIQGAFDREDRPFPEAYDHPGTTARLAELTALAEATGATRGQVVLASLMSRGIRPIVGVSSVEQLDQALGSVDLVSASVRAAPGPRR